MYFISVLLLLLFAFIVFRIIVKNDYLKNGKLSFISVTLEIIIFALHANFLYLFIPVKWPRLPSPPDNFIVYSISLIILIIGLIIVGIAMLGLGYRGSMGLGRKTLKKNGLYMYSRNPQIIGYGLILIAFITAYPSWYALGWILLYIIIAHMMVRTEEKFLQKLYKEEYQEYIKTVPRYFKLL